MSKRRNEEGTQWTAPGTEWLPNGMIGMTPATLLDIVEQATARGMAMGGKVVNDDAAQEIAELQEQIVGLLATIDGMTEAQEPAFKGFLGSDESPDQ